MKIVPKFIWFVVIVFLTVLILGVFRKLAGLRSMTDSPVSIGVAVALVAAVAVFAANREKKFTELGARRDLSIWQKTMKLLFERR